MQATSATTFKTHNTINFLPCSEHKRVKQSLLRAPNIEGKVVVQVEV